MTEYEITMSSGETVYVLAADLEDAAWQAFQLSKDAQTTLKDVIPTYVKQEILSSQMGTDQELPSRRLSKH
tara:strand:+ start:200 stop:412 length:213 start_codon:yes stop_codon:yes gene_type:complete